MRYFYKKEWLYSLRNPIALIRGKSTVKYSMNFMAFFVLTLSITVSLFPASYTDDFALVALMVMIKVVMS